MEKLISRKYTKNPHYSFPVSAKCDIFARCDLLLPMTTLPYYYQILGVTPDATQEDLRRAYRLQARRLHPDVNPASDAHEQFLLLQKAWQTLGNPDKRRTYDYMVKRYPHSTSEEPRYQQRPRTHYQPPSPPPPTRRPYSQYAPPYRATPEEEARSYTKEWIMIGAIFFIMITLPFNMRLAGNILFKLFKADGVVEVVFAGSEIDFFFLDDELLTYYTHRDDLFRPGDLTIWEGGMPLSKGDRFRVKHLPWSKRIHRFTAEYPEEETFQRYCNMIWDEWESRSELEELSGGVAPAAFLYTLCLHVYQESGINGLANLYFAFTHPQVNSWNNKSTYATMKQSARFREIVSNIRLMTRIPNEKAPEDPVPSE
jgi:hypothetical protein